MGRLRPFALEVYFSLQTEYRFTSRYRQLDGRGIGDVAARTSLCVSLGCMWLGWTSEFFESEDNVLLDFDVRDLVQQQRHLQLIEQPLHCVRVKPFGNGVQAVNAERSRLQHLENLPFGGCVSDQLRLIDAPEIPQNASE